MGNGDAGSLLEEVVFLVLMQKKRQTKSGAQGEFKSSVVGTGLQVAIVVLFHKAH